MGGGGTETLAAGTGEIRYFTTDFTTDTSHFYYSGKETPAVNGGE